MARTRAIGDETAGLRIFDIHMPATPRDAGHGLNSGRSFDHVELGDCLARGRIIRHRVWARGPLNPTWMLWKVGA